MSDQEYLFYETRGMALSALTIVASLVTLLYKRGTLTRSEMLDLYEGVLQTVEDRLAATDRAAQLARVLVEGIARTAYDQSSDESSTGP